MLERRPQPRPRDRYIEDLYQRPDAPAGFRYDPPAGANDYRMPRRIPLIGMHLVPMWTWPTITIAACCAIGVACAVLAVLL